MEIKTNKTSRHSALSKLGKSAISGHRTTANKDIDHHISDQMSMMTPKPMRNIAKSDISASAAVPTPSNDFNEYSLLSDIG